VSAPDGSSPLARSLPLAHFVQVLDATWYPLSHRHTVSTPGILSPATRISPAAHATHAFDATRSSFEHSQNV
jgi:hypothetical protein|tara:strand:- start:620 stop:835 length:216 start_codon:yes stop_codon:yes gene_type:complete